MGGVPYIIASAACIDEGGGIGPPGAAWNEPCRPKWFVKCGGEFGPTPGDMKWGNIPGGVPTC